MNSNEAFEKYAEKFYKKYGYLPMGKDDPSRPSVEQVLGDLGTTFCELLECAERPIEGVGEELKFPSLDDVNINCNRFDPDEDLAQRTTEFGVIRRVYNFIYRKASAPTVQKEYEYFDCPECDFHTEDKSILEKLEWIKGDSVCPECGAIGTVTNEGIPATPIGGEKLTLKRAECKIVMNPKRMGGNCKLEYEKVKPIGGEKEAEVIEHGTICDYCEENKAPNNIIHCENVMECKRFDMFKGRKVTMIQ